MDNSNRTSYRENSFYSTQTQHLTYSSRGPKGAGRPLEYPKQELEKISSNTFSAQENSNIPPPPATPFKGKRIETTTRQENKANSAFREAVRERPAQRGGNSNHSASGLSRDQYRSTNAFSIKANP